ncbi:MAG: hypothetical protein ACKKMV_03105 [Candidatus Nealsonbacteria bacterium]|nr:MAG: hypothetical protein IB617_02585 [Candidatus Nealsonbacteria bacterium]
MMRKRWVFGFLGFFGIKGIIGIINGDYLEALWILWLVWFFVSYPRKSHKTGSNIVYCGEHFGKLSASF